MDFRSATTHVHSFSLQIFTNFPISTRKLIPALQIGLLSCKCFKLFDYKGDWVVEPSKVMISISEGVVESLRAGIHIEKHSSAAT